MIARLALELLASVVFCAALGFAPAAAEPPMRLAGVTGGVCAAQLDKCTARCRGSGVCTARCLANDRACRAGGAPVYR
jgi:hypothetical protein